MGKLTALQVKAATAPGRYQDGQGLMLVVKESGSRSWQLRVQFNGKRHDYGLGSLERLTLSNARLKAAETRRQVQQGQDPTAMKRASQALLQAIPTFEAASTLLHGERKAGWRNEKHSAQWLSSLRTYAFPKIGRLPVDKVSVPDIRDLLAPIWLAKPETARRVFQRICTVLDWAHAKGHRTAEAPIRAIRAGLGGQKRSDSHFAALPHDRVAALVAKIRQSESVGRLALRFLILTAARSGEVHNAVWSEIDLTSATWTIPPSRMKARREHVVPLSPAAVEILRNAALLRITQADCIIFPGAKGKPLSDMTLTKALRSDLDGKWTVHGFRSSFRDWVAECTSYRSEIAEAALAHSIPNKVEAAYRRTNYLQLRIGLMNDWEAYTHASQSPPSNIYSL